LLAVLLADDFSLEVPSRDAALTLLCCPHCSLWTFSSSDDADLSAFYRCKRNLASYKFKIFTYLAVVEIETPASLKGSMEIECHEHVHWCGSRYSR
jgi:hypothetical protein